MTDTTSPTQLPTDAILAAAQISVQREADALTSLAAQLDASFVQVVLDVLAVTGKVITTGSGTSGAVAYRLAHLLSVSGTPAFYLPCLDALHGSLGAVTADDYVIAFSKGGRSEELNQLVRRLGERGITVLAVTETPDSPFAAAAAHVASISTQPSTADPGELIAMGSTLVAGAWGDALASTLMRLRDHSWSEVVNIHPGGTVGQQTTFPDELTLENGVTR
ncbi:MULTISPECIES: SIS domain-containing protein [unclassified Curtobacterium]|uniref:SIS domain-containing protein n=1 Tax=unclassified Curtobacterium TaxID=257496 RepID=UPI00226B5E98|nr:MULTISPECIES: SIS domain-containing protein [unclassified Curtobacterium]